MSKKVFKITLLCVLIIFAGIGLFFSIVSLLAWQTVKQNAAERQIEMETVYTYALYAPAQLDALIQKAVKSDYSLSDEDYNALLNALRFNDYPVSTQTDVLNGWITAVNANHSSISYRTYDRITTYENLLRFQRGQTSLADGTSVEYYERFVPPNDAIGRDEIRYYDTLATAYNAKKDYARAALSCYDILNNSELSVPECVYYAARYIMFKNNVKRPLYQESLLERSFLQIYRDGRADAELMKTPWAARAMEIIQTAIAPSEIAPTLAP